MQILSFQMDHPHIRAALVDRKNKTYSIRLLKYSLLDDPNFVKELYNGSFKGKVATGLSGKDLFIRTLQVNVGKTRYLKDAITLQSEAMNYFLAGEVVNIPLITKKGKKNSEALNFTASKKAIQETIDVLTRLSIAPDQVGAWPLALVNYIKWKLPEIQNAIIVDLGSSAWTSVYMENRALKRSSTIQGGVEELISAFWEDRKKILLFKELEGIAKQFDLKKVFRDSELPTLQSKLDKMRKELSKIVFSFTKDVGPIPIIYTGRIDAFKHLREVLNEGMESEVIQEESFSAPTEESKYAIVIGLGMLPSLQFLQGEFFPKKMWKKAGKLAFTFCFLSLLATLALFHFGSKMLVEKENELTDQVQTALAQWDPSFQVRERNLNELISSWSRSIRKEAKEYPYIVKAPKVSEVLSWIYNHPLLLSLKREGDPLKLLHFNYELKKFPHIGSQNENYQAIVEMEFEIQNPINARKFHELLLDETIWIDSDQEITWDVEKGIYRTSFYLKNRGPNV